jgi:hypothetical protein
MIGSKNAWTTRKEPIAIPSGIPIAAERRKPRPIRRVLAQTSCAKPSWANMLYRELATVPGLGRKKGLWRFGIPSAGAAPV